MAHLPGVSRIQSHKVLGHIVRIRISLMKQGRVSGEEVYHGRTKNPRKHEEALRPGVRARVQEGAHRIYAKTDLVRPMDYAQIVIEPEIRSGVRTDKEIGPEVCRESVRGEIDRDEVAVVIVHIVDSHLLWTKSLRARRGSAHPVSKDAEGVHDGGAEQIRVAQSEGIRHVVRSGAVGG